MYERTRITMALDLIELDSRGTSFEFYNLEFLFSAKQSNRGQKIYIFKYKEELYLEHISCEVRRGCVPAKRGCCQPRTATKGRAPVLTVGQPEGRACSPH